MSDTYNPNEIVRCKHLNEFARQLRIKLDGGTDPKDSPVIMVESAATISQYVLEDGVYHFTFTLGNMQAKGSFFNLILRGAGVNAQTKFPIITLSPDTAYIKDIDRILPLSRYLISVYLRTPNTPQEFIINMLFPESDTTSEFLIKFKITITED